MRWKCILVVAIAAATGVMAAEGGRQWKGTLVDADCTPSTPAKMAAIQSPDMKSNAPQVEESGSAARAEVDRREAASRPGQKPSEHAGHWRASQWRSCPATAATKHFGIVESGGRMLRFDAHGDSLAASRFKPKSNRTETSAATREVTVKGTAAGETLRVESVR